MDESECFCAEILRPNVGNAAAVFLSDDLNVFFDGDFAILFLSLLIVLFLIPELFFLAASCSS